MRARGHEGTRARKITSRRRIRSDVPSCPRALEPSRFAYCKPAYCRMLGEMNHSHNVTLVVVSVYAEAAMSFLICSTFSVPSIQYAS